MNAVSFFLRRTRSSQKDAARLQKLLSCLSVCGGRQRENFFGGVCFLGVFWLLFGIFWLYFLVFCESTFSCFWGGFGAVAWFLVDFAVMAAKGSADT